MFAYFSVSRSVLYKSPLWYIIKTYRHTAFFRYLKIATSSSNPVLQLATRQTFTFMRMIILGSSFSFYIIKRERSTILWLNKWHMKAPTHSPVQLVIHTCIFTRSVCIAADSNKHHFRHSFSLLPSFFVIFVIKKVGRLTDTVSEEGDDSQLPP